MLCKRGLIYTICFLGAVLSSYSLSQLGIFPTLIAVGLLLCGIMVWRGRSPQDFVIENYLPRLFISTMCAIVFFVAYRRVQPTNYRAYDLAALGILVCVHGLLILGQEWLQKIAWRPHVRS